ncbi:hypothetical protein AAVH_22738 [Aphelenchoides avenae]|nr:hypothetical protein AAVH_22738 [Aphelenchus avenae]
MQLVVAGLVLALLAVLQTPAFAQVWKFPVQYRFIYASSTSVSSTDFTACQNLVKTKFTKGFFGFDTSSKMCTYGQKIKGFIKGTSTVTPAAWVSTSDVTVTTVDWVQAETFIMNEVYGSNECPENTALSGEWCVTTIPNKLYGNYLAGHYANNTILVLTKTKVKDSLKYECDHEMGVRMTFGGFWYCYTLYTTGITASYSSISGNACENMQPGSSVIKFTDKDRECGFINENKEGKDIYLGLVLPPGVTKSAAAYKYYDGSLPGTLPWGTGYPNVTDSSKNLVICDAVQWGKIRDVTALNMKALMCKKAAKLMTTTTSTTTTSTTTTTTTTTTTITTPTTTTPTTTTVPQCVALNGTQVGLIVNIGVNEQDAGVTGPVIANCSCSAGNKRFWQSAATANPSDASGAGQRAIGIQCADQSKLGVIDDTGATCQPGATAPTTLSIYPYCKGTVCKMYAVQEGPDASSMTCSNGKSFTLMGQFVNDVDPDIHTMDPTASPQVYIRPGAVSCSGCAPIQNDVCTGPAKPTGAKSG